MQNYNEIIFFIAEYSTFHQVDGELHVVFSIKKITFKERQVADFYLNFQDKHPVQRNVKYALNNRGQVKIYKRHIKCTTHLEN